MCHKGVTDSAMWLKVARSINSANKEVENGMLFLNQGDFENTTLASLKKSPKRELF